MSPRIRGILPAALTPFNDDFSVNMAKLVAFYAELLEAGCDGIVSMGTTCEANSLSFAERLGVMEAVAEAGLSPRTIVGVGCCNLPETVALAKKACRSGAAGVLVMPPFFYRDVSQEGIFAAYAHTIEMIGADQIPFYIYDFPKMSGIDIALETIIRLREAFPGVIVGLKNSSGDFAEMKQQHEALDDFDVFSGTEEYLLDGLRAGFAGSISATFNLFAKEGAAVMQNWQGPEANALQDKLSRKRRTVAAYPLFPAAKGLIARRKGDASWANIRPPQMPLGADIIEELDRKLGAV